MSEQEFVELTKLAGYRANRVAKLVRAELSDKAELAAIKTAVGNAVSVRSDND